MVGTSAEVYPAASLPETAKRCGTLIVKVNSAEADLSRWAALSLHGGHHRVALVELIALWT